MRRNWGVLFCLLILVFLSGCAAMLYPKGATENYKLGYKDGLRASSNSTEGMLAGMIGYSFYIPSKLPDAEQKKIQNEPLEYQRGFTDGWMAGIDADAFLYDWVYNCPEDNYTE